MAGERRGKPPAEDPISEYFGFHTMPFGRNVPVDQLLELNGQQEMQARLRLAMRDHSIAVITGPGGCGKSTVLRTFVQRLDPNRHRVLYVPNPAPGLTGVYRDMLKELGHQPTYFKPQLVSQVRIALGDVAGRGLRTVILFDEAHQLTDHWLEELRMLLSTDMDSASLATLVLVGHPELTRRLRMAIHEALWSRITVRYHLRPLNLEESARYIHHHATVAGGKAERIFSDGFIARAHEYTGGLPRRINLLCTYALIAAKATGARLIDETIYQRAHNDLEENAHYDKGGD